MAHQLMRVRQAVELHKKTAPIIQQNSPFWAHKLIGQLPLGGFAPPWIRP